MQVRNYDYKNFFSVKSAKFFFGISGHVAFFVAAISQFFSFWKDDTDYWTA